MTDQNNILESVGWADSADKDGPIDKSDPPAKAGLVDKPDLTAKAALADLAAPPDTPETAGSVDNFLSDLFVLLPFQFPWYMHYIAVANDGRIPVRMA